MDKHFSNHNQGRRSSKRLLINAVLMTAIIMGGSLSGCSSITIRPDGGVKDVSPPTYLDSKKYYLGGAIGEHDIDVKQICKDKKVEQMQSVATLSDMVRSALTLGILYFKTAKVWCEE